MQSVWIRIEADKCCIPAATDITILTLQTRNIGRDEDISSLTCAQRRSFELTDRKFARAIRQTFANKVEEGFGFDDEETLLARTGIDPLIE